MVFMDGKRIKNMDKNMCFFCYGEKVDRKCTNEDCKKYKGGKKDDK